MMRRSGLLVFDDLPEWRHNQQQPSSHGPRKPAGVGLIDAGLRGKDLAKARAFSYGLTRMTQPPEQIASLDAPAVLVDLDVVERNIPRFLTHANKIGVAVPLHNKTHKRSQIGPMQLKAGAVGITRQKTSDAEVMVEADSWPNDVLVSDKNFARKSWHFCGIWGDGSD